MEKKDEQDLLEIQTGKDEMNLAEFPITLLTRRNIENTKTIRFNDTITGPEGKQFDRKWIITGSDEFGLPLAQDNDVLMAIFSLGKMNNFASSTINFSRYKLLKTMNWKDDGKNYKRIKEALNRLLGVTIYAENAFWDNNKKRYVTLGFGIIDSYSLYDSYKGPGQEAFSFSSVELNKYIYNSIKAGYIKGIDMKAYFKLESDIAKRLYRYLDKKRYSKERFEINLYTLAQTHIGLAKTKYASHIKEKLNPVHQELIKVGFIKSVEYQKTSDGTSEKIVYIFGKKEAPSKVIQESVTIIKTDNKLLNALVKIGITQKVAEQLIKEYSEDLIDSQIKALPYRKADDLPAVLISSIQDKWAMPANYKVQIDKIKKTEVEIQQDRDLEKNKAEHRKKIEDYLISLTKDELAELTRQAEELARKDGGSFLKDRKIPEHMLKAYIHVIVEEKLLLKR